MYADKSAWVYYETAPQTESRIAVYRRCHCGRFLKKGEVWTNGLGRVKLVGWICKKHDEVQPQWVWHESDV